MEAEKAENLKIYSGATAIYGIVLAIMGSSSTSCACKEILSCFQKCVKIRKEVKT
jgi:hypothetical protein